MESALPMETGGEVGTVACCECGTSIQPNSANISSVGGFSSHLYIITPANLQHCKFCDRYLVPPNGWLFAALESKELLSLCLKRLKPQLTNVRLVDAAFIWTEPHSKRVKVKLTVQKEVFTNAVLQQTFVVEFVICGQVCEECHRVQAKDYWRACVQVRQKCEFKKTLFTLEQTLLKHDALQQCTSVKPVPTGMDFFFAKQQDARKLLEFINTILPCKYHYSQQLISQDIRNNTFDYKHTYCIDVCPITKDSLICLPKRLAQSYGNLGQMVVCLRVSSVIQLINPQTLQMVELNGLTYFKDPFEILLDPKALVEFYVIEEESIDNYQHPNGHGHISTKHHLSHLFVCRASEVGVPDATIYSAKTHLGNFVTVGDTVFGYDLVNCNVNSDIWDQLSDDEKPDVILAIHYKNPDLLRELIVANPGILNATRTHDGRSALHYAAIHGSTDCIGVLLDGTEIDVDAVAGITDSLKTSLLLAADLGHLTAYSIRRESQKLRQELCAACTTNNYGQVMTTLSKCTTQNRREILGAGKTDEDGKSALYLACEHGYSEIVRALLTVKDHSTMDTQSGNTVLHAACKSNNFATIQLVFEAFPEQVDVINDEKSLPLHLACEVGNLEAVRFHLNLSDDYFQFRIQLFSLDQNDQLIPTEIGSPLLLDTYAINGRTPLMTAVCNIQTEIVELLLDSGADVNLPLAITDLEVACLTTEEVRCVGSGALIEAALANHLDLLQLLFFHGAVDYDNQALRNVLMAITRLDLSDNQLTQLPDEIFQLRSLKSLNLDRNKLDELVLPRGEFGCPFLETFNAEDNQIMVIPDTFFDCTHFPNLRTVNLSGNRLRRLPATTWRSPKLHELNVSRNEITDILAHYADDSRSRRDARVRHGRSNATDGAVRRAMERRGGEQRNPPVAAQEEKSQETQRRPSVPVFDDGFRANIWQNEINIAPVDDAEEPSDPSVRASIRGLETNGTSNSIKILNLSGSRSKSVARNQQRSLSIIRASKEIENHDLCAHKMHCRLENLKTLNLSQNQLQTLDLFIPFETRHVDSMPDAANWKEMQLRSHLIFPVLTNLDVSHNELKLLPSNISLLTQLAVLNLSENRQLEKLPVELGLLEKLWSVSVGGCLLKDPLKEIVASGNFKTMDLLSFLRNELDKAEGQTSKSALSNNESWAARIGHSPSRSASKSSFSTKERRALVDVAEWIYEPPKSSKTMKSEGSVTFRTWDFDRLQKDFQQIPQYFMTRRSICLVVWKVTDGEIAINEIHEWLLAIHARAPNTTVIIVGSHLDCVEENIKRFPDNYLENLEQIIQQRFVNIADSDKKGLPKVVASTFVSVKTRFNIQHLCQLIYYAAQQVKTPARRTKLLQEKVPSSFLRLEKFRQACQFLHENGAIVTFDDTQLRDFCFIDPPWLYTVLRTILSQPQRSTTSLVSTAANSGTTLISTTDLFVQLKANLAQRRIKFSLKHSQLRECLLSLLAKFEIALPSFTRTLLISPLLPDEYLLRADYPGAKIRCRSKIDKFRCRQQPSMYQSFTTSSITDSEPAMSSSRYSTARSAHNRLGRSLGFRSHQFASATQSNGETDGLTVDSKEKVEDVYRRIYLMQYVPVGFWPRLTARILNDEKLCNTIAELFVLGEDEEEMGFKSRLSNDCALFCEVNDALNGETSDDRKGGFDFLLWQTGIEVRLFGEYICSLKQFLPLANVRDTNYSMADLHRRSDDLQWRRLSIANEFVVELLIPLMDMNLTWKGMDYRVRTCEKQATRFLASLVGIVDDLLEDWFPALGTRFVHTSDGQLLVDRLITCNQCAQMQQQEEKHERKTSDPTRKTAVYLFSVEECILEVHDQQNQRSKLRNECPIHGQQDVAKLAPDIVFSDLAVDFVYEPHNVKKGKLIGSGAFGCVYSGYARSRLDVFDEVALKVLQQNGNTQFERPMLVDTSDRLETIARSYCVARQELNLLGDLEHTNITLLIGFSRPPITLLMELAPHGALDQMLSRYKRSELRLQWSTLQQTCGQAENVLVWKFPLPHGKSTNSAVQVKLGDYGISRFSYPSDVCKGYGGTEGFMAPEILRYNGEFEYTEKVDCYSFGIFIYELISLRHPFDNQDQMKDCIFEGQRPLVSEKDILCPTNVLDLMVACWSENAANRPSSSELVTITSAPEFTNLSDVAVLSGGEMSQVAAVIVGNNDELSSQLSPQCWLSRADGTFTVLNFNQFGFIDAETVGPLKTSQWTAIAEIRAFKRKIEIPSHNIKCFSSDLPINSSPYESRTIRSIGWFAERSVLLITLPHAVLLCSRPQGGILPQWLATVRSEEFVNASTLLHSASDYQLWTAHDEARVVMHHLAGSTHRLLYSASASHSNRPEDGKRVKFLVPSRQSYGHAWSSLENDGRVFMWENGVIRRTLDCSKILPVSESLSSMTIFDEEENEVNGKEATIDEENIRLRSGIGGKRSRITALAVYQTNLCVEQLVVGTSLGVIIILECKTLSPLTSFRTYTSAVETILCANSQKPSGRQSKTNDEPGFAADSYFVTIGRRYRNLIKRLALNVCDSTEQPEDANFAVVWQGDQWRT
ncbi:Non-specific serine/threonine protein kinase [Aphelenchoides besseyi]|nr:Non-specific serine/threonine protein kinase [Aphelenchoides besseyi]